MFEDLADYLAGVVPEERVSLLIEICENLDDLTVHAIHDRVNEILSRVDNVDNATVIELLDQVLLDNLGTVLATYGITLDDDQYDTSQLRTYNQILNTLLIIEHYEDPQSLLDIIQAGESPELIMATICEVVVDLPSYAFLECVSAVRPNVIVGLTNAMQRPSADEEDTRRLEEYIIARLRLAVQNQRSGVFYDYIKQGGALGLPLDVMIEAIGQRLDGLEPKDAARQIWLLTLASDTPDSAIPTAVRSAIESVYPDVDFAYRVNAEVTGVLAGGA